MVEVFCTNVLDAETADFLLKLIHERFKSYQANFDLEDCDRILRIACETEILALPIILLLRQQGFEAKVLEEEEELTLIKAYIG